MFTAAYTHFFQELTENNSTAWFHAHKKRYEEVAKGPFLELLNRLLPTLTEWDHRILPDAKKALFRINRDIRFSKDKSPYHLILKAGFSPNGKKSVLPGYYLGIDAHHIHVGGGLFMVQSPELKKIRTYIAENTPAFLNLMGSENFRQHFGALKGEKAKRLDKDLLPVADKTPLIYNKQFYAMAEFPLEPFYQSEKLPEEILAHFAGIRPLNEYLNQALH
ncbi:DUF2461 domain-containing protein [Flavobacteriaceae bacterium 3-367]